VAWYRDNEWWWRKIKSGDFLAFYEAQYGDRLQESWRVRLTLPVQAPANNEEAPLREGVQPAIRRGAAAAAPLFVLSGGFR
jgi:hypothetical protein